MEPLDPSRNVEGSGFSKRRISSILKAPRRSTICRDPEQQENEVESAAPVEKRNSRRVSFAPANDVLLFAKDAKNASPVRSPLQELMTAAAATTQNRVQVSVTEDVNQQIMGIENLLNAPLHASQQRDAVNFDTGIVFGEKTVMFSTEDAVMDMTQSHTINIASDAELLGDISMQNYDILAGEGRKVTVDDQPTDVFLSHIVNMKSGSVPLPTGRSADLSVEKRNLSSKLPCLDPGFENFLASLSKPSNSSTRMMSFAEPSSEETSISLCQNKTQRANADKENQVPKSRNASRKVGESFKRNSFCPEGDMDMTETQTGRILGVGDDDPFQCLFPTQTMYIRADKRTSQMKEVEQQHSSKTLGSADPKEKKSLINPLLHAPHQRSSVISDPKDEYREKTIIFTADECLDMTQSHTVNIASSSLSPVKKPSNSLDLGFNDFLHKTPGPHTGKENWSSNTNKSGGESFSGGIIGPKDDTSMDLTEAQTGRIAGLTGLDDPFQFLIPSQGVYPVSESRKEADVTCRQQSSGFRLSNQKGMETSIKASVKSQLEKQQEKLEPEDDQREKTVRFSADDACMDVTRSHTVDIATDLKLQLYHDVDLTPSCGEKTVRFTVDDAPMDITQCLTVNIDSNLVPDSVPSVRKQESETCGPPSNGSSSAHRSDPGFRNPLTNISKPSDDGVNPAQSSDGPAICPEDDVSMDMTEVQTGCIAEILGTDDPPQCLLPIEGMHPQSVNLKKTEMTSHQQSNEATGTFKCKVMETSLQTSLKPKMQRHQVKFDAEDECREKTVRFTFDDACMDVTRSHTSNIVSHLPRHSYQTADCAVVPANGEKTMRFTADDASMDVTRSHTVNIATDLNMVAHQNVDLLPANTEKTTRFTADDASMDVARSHTVNIASNFASGLVKPLLNFPLIHENINFPVCAKKSDNEACVPHSNRPSLAHGVNQEFENSLSETRAPWEEAADAPSPHKTYSNGFLVHFKTQKPDINTENEAPSLALPVMEKPVNKTVTDCPETSLSMDMTEAQTGCILEQTCTDDPLQSLSSTPGPSSDHLLKTDLTSLGSSNSDDAEIKNPPDCLDANETGTMKEHEPTPTACLSQKTESSPSTVDQDGDASRSRKSRRMSLADLQSKVRRLSHIINTAPDALAIASCTAPLPQLNQDLNKNSNDKTTSLPQVEPELDMVNTRDKTQALGLKQAERLSATSTATPFNLKTKNLMSRLSVGGFKPKLPQRANPDESKKVASAGEPTRTVTVNVTSQLNNFDNDVSDIYDEELGSYEDISETLETRNPDKNFDKERLTHEFNMFEPFEEECARAVHGQKRSLPKDEDSEEDEKRLKASTEFIEPAHESDAAELDGNIATTHITTQTIDSSNSSHTASRCEIAFESTIKNSLFESQLEDYASDAQKKLEDGTITVLEFFKLFNIDFVIHNPRQSIVPGRLLSENAKPLDLLKDRHISLPKQLVYEMDIQTLAEKVEGLKVRMRDLDKPLKTVNSHLWEEMRYSSEKEMKPFGAKLKEKNNFFRKTSKVQSHEMKEVLYSNLVRANQEEQQKLRGTIEEADGMIKSLDECICELEAELAAVEEKGTEERPSLKSLQEETKKVTEALADNNRQISELEMQKMQNLSKFNRLKAETRNLESHINMLNMVNEWKFRENKDNCAVYTFLHETLLLQLVYEKSNDSGSEQKITNIAFELELDDEKSHFHARLVHKLVSQYIEGESAWVEKYPTRRHVPKLLHEISLVVSRCRLLGEELRLLKMWGGLRLDILDISCKDTRLHIVFSSLKTFSKFEVVFAISLIDQVCVLHVESFKNMIGSTTIQQIEEIVASFAPGKNFLTKIVRKIHDTLLR